MNVRRWERVMVVRCPVGSACPFGWERRRMREARTGSSSGMTGGARGTGGVVVRDDWWSAWHRWGRRPVEWAERVGVRDRAPGTRVVGGWQWRPVRWTALRRRRGTTRHCVCQRSPVHARRSVASNLSIGGVESSLRCDRMRGAGRTRPGGGETWIGVLTQVTRGSGRRTRSSGAVESTFRLA